MPIPPDFRQLLLAPDEGGERCGQVVEAELFFTGSADITIADAFVELDGLILRLDAQLLLQTAATGLVLDQGSGAFSAESQQAHQAALGSFLPGFQLHLAAGILAGLLEVAALLPGVSKLA